jgi:hypothetical protein
MNNIYHRLKFYGFGLLIGILLVSVLFKGRSGCRTPNSLKIEELRKQHLEYTDHGKCRMTCRGISEKDIKFILEKGSVNFSKSDPRDKPCPSYAVEGTTPNERELRIICADCDSITRIVTAIDLKLEKDTCDCK